MPIPKNMLIFYTHPIELFSYWPNEKLWKLHFLLSVCNTVSSPFLVGLFVYTRKMSFGDMALPEPFMLSWHGPWAREANIITKPSHNTIALHVTSPDLTCPLEQTDSCIYDVHAYMCVCAVAEKKKCADKLAIHTAGFAHTPVWVRTCETQSLCDEEQLQRHASVHTSMRAQTCKHMSTLEDQMRFVQRRGPLIDRSC